MLQSHSPKFRQVEVPQIEYEDQVVQVPVQKQVQVPHVQTVQKTVEIPQIEPPGSVSQHTVRFFDGIRGISEYDMLFVWNLSKVFRTVGFQDLCGPASRYVDKVVPLPVAKQVQVPMVNTLSGTAEELFGLLGYLHL